MRVSRNVEALNAHIAAMRAHIAILDVSIVASCTLIAAKDSLFAALRPLIAACAPLITAKTPLDLSQFLLFTAMRPTILTMDQPFAVNAPSFHAKRHSFVAIRQSIAA
jgi:hypothetical protein